MPKKFIALGLMSFMLQWSLPVLANPSASIDAVITEPVGLQNPVSVAVLDLESGPEDLALSQALADVLRIHLFKAPGIQVLERSRLKDVLSEQRLQDSAYCGETCLAKAGKILGLDDVIVGAVHRIDGFYSIHLRIVKVSTGRVTAVATAQCKCSIEELLTQTSQDLSAQLLEHVYADVRMGKLVIQSEPTGADVYYQSKLLGRTPLEFQRMPAGHHELEVVKQDYLPEKFKVHVKPHHSQQKTLTLTSVAESSILNVNSKPQGAQVLIDGRLKGQTPLEIQDLTRGVYQVELKLEGHSSESHHVLLETGQKLMYDAVLHALPQTQNKLSTVRVFSQPSGAEVWIQGQKVGHTPYVTQLQGSQELQLKQMGYLTWTKDLKLTDAPVSVEAVLEPDQTLIGLWTAAGVGMALILGSLFVQRQNAMVFVNNESNL